MINVEIYRKSGTHVILNKKHILIDPLAHHESDIVLISHAHSDHINTRILDKFEQPVYMSEPTREIVNERSNKKFDQENIQIVKNGDTIDFDGIKIKVFDAGHCIGSLQFRIDYRQQKVIYTGDFCIESRMGMQKGAILQGKNSVLITDSTYSDAKYDFPPRMQIYGQILNWINTVFKKHNTAVLFARQLGTSQELTDLINISTLNCDLWVHPKIYYHNLIHHNYYPLGDFIYRKNPFDGCLDDYFQSNPRKNRRKRVYLLPIYYYNKNYLPKLKNRYDPDSMAICTGWALTTKFMIKSFALSSHADYKNIQQYYTQSGAKEIFYF